MEPFSGWAWEKHPHPPVSVSWLDGALVGQMFALLFLQKKIKVADLALLPPTSLWGRWGLRTHDWPKVIQEASMSKGDLT